jgi:hypothetical protein
MQTRAMSRLSISNSEVNKIEHRTIIKFLGRLAIFLFPLFLIVATIEAAWWRAGDSWPVEQAFVVQYRNTDETLYGRGYFSQQFGLYKLAGINHKRPLILTVGSSRVMQIRNFLFAPLEEHFYNAGGMLQNAFDLKWLANAFEKRNLPIPKVIIVGIDPWWLRANRGLRTWLTDEDEAFSFVGHLEAMRGIGKHWGIGDLIDSLTLPSKSPYFNYPAIGSVASKHGNGFRKDGSRQYSPKILLDYLKNPRYVDREDPPVVERIHRLSNQFTVPVILDNKRVQVILKSLLMMQKAGIEVYAFMPPFSSRVFKALDESVELRNWWQYYKNDFPNLLKKHGIKVIPVAQPAFLGLSDSYMIDGFHSSEVYMAYVIKTVIENANSSSYLKKVDIESLSHRIKNAPIPLAFEIPNHNLNAYGAKKKP